MDFTVRCWGKLPTIDIWPPLAQAQFVNRDEAASWALQKSQCGLLVYEVFQESSRTIFQCYRHGEQCDITGRPYPTRETPKDCPDCGASYIGTGQMHEFDCFARKGDTP